MLTTMCRRLLAAVLPFLIGSTIYAAATDTRLIEAVKAQRQIEVEDLISHHVDVNTPDFDGSTALHWAAYKGETATVARLIAAGAKPSIANRYGVTPLSVACESGNAPTVKLLPD